MFDTVTHTDTDPTTGLITRAEINRLAACIAAAVEEGFDADDAIEDHPDHLSYTNFRAVVRAYNERRADV